MVYPIRLRKLYACLIGGHMQFISSSFLLNFSYAHFHRFLVLCLLSRACWMFLNLIQLFYSSYVIFLSI